MIIPRTGIAFDAAGAFAFVEVAAEVFFGQVERHKCILNLKHQRYFLQSYYICRKKVLILHQ